MATSGQQTGMRGVYLVAAELSRRGLIASPTSRSAAGADILVTDDKCSRSFSVQVKANAKTFNFWLVGAKAADTVSTSHYYVFINIRDKEDGTTVEYYVVPSKMVAKHTKISEAKSGSKWWTFRLKDALKYKDAWHYFLSQK